MEKQTITIIFIFIILTFRKYGDKIIINRGVISYPLTVPLKEAVEMDIKMLEGSGGVSELTVRTLENMANRQKRREFFYRSALRSALLTLLFIAFGCLFAIYRRECGRPVSPGIFISSPFELRTVLKEFFFISSVPASCFAVCFCFGGKLCRLCDTFFPAVFGIYSGALFYGEISKIASEQTAASAFRGAPAILFTLAVIAAYALFCSVCASYGECKQNGGAVREDANSCFTYFLICETALLVFILLRGCGSAILDIFG